MNIFNVFLVLTVWYHKISTRTKLHKERIRRKLLSFRWVTHLIVVLRFGPFGAFDNARCHLAVSHAIYANLCLFIPFLLIQNFTESGTHVNLKMGLAPLFSLFVSATFSATYFGCAKRKHMLHSCCGARKASFKELYSHRLPSLCTTSEHHGTKY